MKKLLLTTLVLAAGIAQADFWDNCTAYGGTIITANSYGNDKGGYCNNPNDPNLSNNCNGQKFCVGPRMNWWSAFTWCESVGGKLASFDTLCPAAPTMETRTNGACSNIVGIGGGSYAWTSTGWSSNKVLHPIVASGQILTVGRTASDLNPFCVENH